MKRSDEQSLQQLRRLHPISILFFIVKSAKDLVYPLIAFLVTTVFRGEVNFVWLVAMITFFAVLLIVMGLLQWLRFGYMIENGALKVEHGVWVRKKIWISRDRVQSVDTSAGLFHRPFGLVKLQVETAGGKKPEAILSAIAAGQAEQIRAELVLPRMAAAQKPANEMDERLNGQTADPAAETPAAHKLEAAADQVRSVIPLKDLLVYSSTSGQIGIVLAVFGTVFSQLDKLLKGIDLWGFMQRFFGPTWGIWVAVIVLLLAWVTAFIATVMTEYNYTLTLKDDKLVIEKGLLERKHITIALERIQAVHLVENILRRPFGYVCIRVVTAGYGGKDGKTGLLFPVIKTSEVEAFLSRFVPQAITPAKWHTIERRALRNYLLIPVTVSLLVIIAPIVFIPDHWGWLSLLLPLIAAWWSVLRFRQAGWSLDDNQLAVRMGGFTRQTALMPKQRIQWHQVTQSPFQVRRRLATFRVALASGGAQAHFYIRHAGVQAAQQISAWLSARK
ncbi:PH domain-containing protein [Paenibacillus sp. GCM10027626]|uniref:PH domain-containing protein n=1 Tax=Paenibacillus sp. GCM10027626 TaxID=3273411 RepID=UPI00363EC6EC